MFAYNFAVGCDECACDSCSHVRPHFFVIAFAAVVVNAQSPPARSTSASSPLPSATPIVFAAETLADLKRVQQAALTSNYAFRQVAHLSNNIGPRLTGSPQAAQAVDYVAGELKSLGCEVQLEKCMVPHWVRGEERGELVQWPGMAANTTQKVVLCALGPSVATPPAGISAEVVPVKDFDELKSLGKDRIAGKIVLFTYSFDKRMAAENRAGEAYGEAVVYRADGPVAAARFGAVACLIRSVGGAEFRLPHTGWTHYAEDAPKIPAAALTSEDVDMIVDLARQGAVKMKLVLTPQTLPEVESANVIGDIKGGEHPDEIVIVSGHLDSWDLGTGAIDDAAGVAVSMEVANLIRKLQLRPKRTIRIVAWMNEENGSRGSKQYAADNVANLAKHFAAIETDNGAGHPIGLNIKGAFSIKTMLAPLMSILQQSGAGGVNWVEHCGADIEPLEKVGVPSFAPIQDSRSYFNYHHSAADTFDKVVPNELAENSAVVAVTACALANMEQPLPR